MPPPVEERRIGSPPNPISSASPPVANRACGSIGIKSAFADEAIPKARIVPVATASTHDLFLRKIAPLFDIKLQVYNGSLWFAKTYMVMFSPLQKLGSGRQN